MSQVDVFKSGAKPVSVSVYYTTSWSLDQSRHVGQSVLFSSNQAIKYDLRSTKNNS